MSISNSAVLEQAQPFRVPAELLRAHNVAGPRYTSYPTAAHFTEIQSVSAVEVELLQSARISKPISLYFHIPFCRSLCWYCACTKIITRRGRGRSRYVDYLIREMELKQASFGESKVVQLHWGGGTPTFLEPEDIRRLGHAARDLFKMDAGAEMSVEIDPRELTPAHVEALREVGFRRASLGVQDHHPRVQQAIHRIQPFTMTRDAVQSLRNAGFDSINVDLIYGLPHQTVESFRKTIDATLALHPDRFAIYAYAHVPWVVPGQKLLEGAGLPHADTKIGMLQMIIEHLDKAGYVHIGMDHFAKPDDELAVALTNETLQRNFQGYSTQGGVDIHALGMSGISQTTNCYVQNHKNLEAYYEALDTGHLPFSRITRLTKDDRIRRQVIMHVMCKAYLAYSTLSEQLNIDFKAYFSDSLKSLKTLERDGLVRCQSDGFEVTSLGRLFLRNIAMCFDAYLERPFTRYSRTV